MILVPLLSLLLLMKAITFISGLDSGTVFFGQYLPGFRFRLLLNQSWRQCYNQCAVRAGCQSINYFRHMSLCELNSNKSGATIQLAASSKWIYTEYNQDNADEEQTACEENLTCDSRVHADCPIQECGPPIDLVDPLVVARGNALAIGNRISYACPFGYRRLGSSHMITCLPNGTWSEADTVCEGRWTCYKYNDQDRAKMYLGTAEKDVCESNNRRAFTHGNNVLHPFCMSCWCCEASL